MKALVYVSVKCMFSCGLNTVIRYKVFLIQFGKLNCCVHETKQRTEQFFGGALLDQA